MALTLKSNITATQTPIDVNGADALSNGDLYTIEDEQIFVVTASAGSTQPGQTAWQRVDVLRGALGTTEVAHSAGTAVTLVETPLGAGGGGSLPDWFVADENNQTFDFFGGFHLNSSDTPPVGNGDVTITIDGRDSSTTLVSLTPTATNQRPLDIVAPAGQSVALIAVRLNGTDRFLLTSSGALTVIPGGVNNMLQVNAGDVAIAGSTVYIEDGLIELGSSTTLVVQPDAIGFYGATPAGQPAAVADGTDAASTMARLNDLLARLRTLGIIDT